MRIDLSTITPNATEHEPSASAVSRAETEASTRAALTQDTANLSPDQAQALAAQVNQLPDVRQEKVAALGRVIAQGNYQVTAQQTAEALISQITLRPAA